ncbi:MAG: thioredoxin family protein [Bacteroidetes bacterium]|nr:thioredoxin family protein [Bacteroidota bacterium]MDA1120075.1 thioredoxin family protein [Bacteroidota bacterium]
MRQPQIFFGYFLLGIFPLVFNVNAQKKLPDSLPDFNFPGVGVDSVKNSFFGKGRPLIVFYFDPTCSHCEKQAQWISESIEGFEGVDLLWLAWEINDAIPVFKEHYFSQASDNLYFAIDPNYSFDGIFGFSEIPTVFIFDGKNNLMRKFKGEIKAERLLKILNRNSQ